MHLSRLTSRLGLAALVLGAACQSLDVENPNAPDTKRAFEDAGVIEAIVGGTVRSFYNTWEGMETAGPLSTQAQTYTSSWNNFNMNFYSSIDGDGTRNSRAWQNDLASSGRTSVEWSWYGYYSVISPASSVLRALRIDGVDLGSPSANARAASVSELMLCAGLMGIALNYDKGYFIDETIDVRDPVVAANLVYINRAAMRDSAVAKCQSAAAIASATSFTTPAAWHNGYTYSNTQIAQLANTLAAVTLAYWPRTDAENASVNWSQVATFTSNGIDFDWNFNGDGCDAWCPEVLLWFNGIDGGRVHTRVANLMDPVTQQTPWPLAGNPQPNSPDRRLGDGSFGDESLVDDFGTTPATANAGTDFAWSSLAIFRPARGSYHQSNIGHIRYDASGVQDPQGIYGGFGRAPALIRASNDLLRAEAELRRSGGNLALAASLINRTRVDRGGLSPATAGEGAPSLIQKLIYEQEIELLGLGPSPFYQRRRVPGGLITGTPREMPVPARELGVKGESFYTWGGTGPANSPTP
jgi:hypothetical protein